MTCRTAGTTTRTRAGPAGAALALLLVVAAPLHADPFDAERAAMVRTVESHGRQMRDVLGRDGIAPRVLDAMNTVKRHEFVPEHVRASAYADRPLPIGGGQTISQPFIVALMTHLLAPGPGDVMLEIGTGSGYQAAVLARLAGRVHTVEIVPELARRAEATLERLGYANVSVRAGDGYHGWPEAAPFDGIMVTAAAESVPPALIEQLKPGGRLVMPVGPPGAVQHLTLIEADAAGGVTRRELLPVRFVPFTRR